MRRLSILIVIIASAPLLGQTAQWRGPERTGIYPDTSLLKEWPEEGPELLLKVEGIGDGLSSVVREGDRYYVTGKMDSTDYLSSIDLEGTILWQVPYGKVYVVSGTGRLACLDALSGEEIWAVDSDREYEAVYHFFGVAESPLIVDDRVIAWPTGDRTTAVAFNRLSGEKIWESPPVEGRKAYASAILYEHGDIRQILGFTTKNLVGIDPGNGEVCWTYDYFRHSQEQNLAEQGVNNTNTPLFREDEIFITSGYDCPAVMLKLAEDGKSVKAKWVNPTFDNHHHGVVLIGDYLYGSNFYSNGFGKWVCVDWNTGEVMYLEDWNNKGSMIFADDMLYVYEEKQGHVGLVRPDPKKGFDVVSSFRNRDGRGPHWAHPSIYDGKLLIRHGEVLKVYDIRQ